MQIDQWRVRLIDLFFIITPVFTGASIYLLFRSTEISVFHVIDFVGLRPSLDSARLSARPFNSYFSGFLLYSLPTGLWAFSFAYCTMIVWKDQLKSVSAILSLLALAFVVQGMELAQGIGIVAGTFDAVDFTANFIGLGAGALTSYARPEIHKIKIHRDRLYIRSLLLARGWLSIRKR